MLKKIVFFLAIFFLLSERIVFSYWPPGLSEPIELAYGFSESDNQEGDFDLAREAQFDAVLDYALMLRSEEDIKNYLDLCNQFGFKVFVPLPYYDNETKILDKDEIAVCCDWRYGLGAGADAKDGSNPRGADPVARDRS